MIGVATVLLVALVTWLLLTALLSVAVACLSRGVRGFLLAIDPAQRANLLLLASVLPAVLSFGWIVLVFVPAIGAWLIDAHCHTQMHCAAHVPFAGHIQPGMGGVILVLTALLCTVAFVWRQWRAAMRASRTMNLFAKATEHGYAILETGEPIALSVGWLRPRIIVSSGLRSAVGPEEFAVIVAHEQAHCRRHDSLRCLTAAVASLLFPRVGRGQLLADLRAAVEQACDASAAEQTGDRLRVAATILKFARISRGPSPLQACGFGESSAAERVRALLCAPRPTINGLLWIVAGVPILGTAVVIGAAPVHHVIEALLV